MNEELLIHVMNLFDKSEKWHSFWELTKYQDEIQRRWWKKLQQEVYQREMINGNPNWDIYAWNAWDIKWFIRGENEKSVNSTFRL